jgi:hypothetical protein
VIGTATPAYLHPNLPDPRPTFRLAPETSVHLIHRDLKTHHGPPAWSLHNGFLIAKLEPDFLAFENPLRKYEEVFRAERS